MSERRKSLRKQPLKCLIEYDYLDELDLNDEEKPAPTTPSASKKKTGKENNKRSTAKKTSEVKKKNNVPKAAPQSDSDSDLDEVFQILRKTGIKTEPAAKRKPIKEAPVTNKKSKEARKQLFSDDDDAFISSFKTRDKKIPSSPQSEKTDDSLSFTTPLKKLQQEMLNTQEQLTQLSEEFEKTPRRRKRAFSENSNDCVLKITPAKKKKTAPSPKRELPMTPINKASMKCEIGTTPLKEIEKTPKRNKRMSSVGSDSFLKITPAKRTKTAPSPIREPPGTPISKISRKCETPRTPLEEARLSLHVSSIPNSLPCREQEYKNILNFVETKVYDGVGGCMYISGVPGTGKTATVTQVIRHLQAVSASGDLPPFQFIEINGMRLSDPRQAYVQLYQTIFGKKDRISADSAHKKLDSYFNKGGGKKIATVILVDELDLMCTRKQDVVYNLLDWPSKPRSRLVVLTIANTMDMPERKLKGRVNSRLGLTRLTFLPYTHKQLEEIIMARLQGTDAFVLDAVRLATRKVAAVSGDARRALDICRRAAELPKENEPVRITHIEQAIKEMTNSNIVRLVRSCSEVEKMFLRSVSDVCVRTGLEEVDLLQVVEHLLPLCVLEGFQRPHVPAVLSICNRLRCFRLLFSNNPKGGLMQRLTLNITQDDLHYAFKAEMS